MVSSETKNIVIDSGPDFRQQLLREKVKSLNAVLFTHEHKDHIAGLDDIRAFNYFQNEKMQVFCTEAVEFALKREFSYAFNDNKYPGIPEIALNRIENAPFEIHGIPFLPIKVLHLKMEVFGFRIGDVTYITDANFISDEEKQNAWARHVIHSSHDKLRPNTATDSSTQLRPAFRRRPDLQGDGLRNGRSRLHHVRLTRHGQG